VFFDREINAKDAKDAKDAKNAKNYTKRYGFEFKTAKNHPKRFCIRNILITDKG